MTGTDVAPSRLERAKQKIRDLIALRAGGRVAPRRLCRHRAPGDAADRRPDRAPAVPRGARPRHHAATPAAAPRRRWRSPRPCSPREDAAGSILFVTDGIDPGDIAAFPAGGSARAALIVAADGGGSEVADWSRRADVATVAVTIDDGDVRAVERALASSLARAAAAEGRLQDDGWLLALPAGLLVLLWFRRGTTLRWGAMLLALALLAPARRAAPDGLADWFWTPDQQGRRLYDAHDYPEAAASLRRPRMARRRPLPRRQVPGGRRHPRADPDLGRPVQPRHRAGPRPRLPGRGGRLRGGADARPGERRRARIISTSRRRIIAYLTEARRGRATKAGIEPPDDTVDDLTGEEGKRVRIDAGSQLSEDAADEWMRAVETKPADFLKSRFAIEAARTRSMIARGCLVTALAAPCVLLLAAPPALAQEPAPQVSRHPRPRGPGHRRHAGRASP